MKTKSIFYILLLLIILSSMVISKERLSEIINKANSISKIEYKPEDHSKIQKSKLVRLDSLEFKKLMNRDKWSSESIYLLGKFNIKKDRIGLICYNTAIECDHPIDYVTLHIVDSCKNVVCIKYLSIEDSHGIIYKWSSQISPTFDTLTMKLNRSSEWVAETDSKLDTLFTDVYKFALKSPQIDTLSRTTSYKIIKLK